MSNDRDKVRAPDSEFVPESKTHYKGGVSDQALIDNMDAAIEAIEAFANGGKGDPTQIVRAARALTGRFYPRVEKVLDKLAKRLSGDQLMELGLDIDPVKTMQLALRARPALGTEQLRRYLRGLSAGALAQFAGDDESFTDVRSRLPGALATELPVLAHLPADLHGSDRFVHWYLATTDKTVAALNLADVGSVPLAKTLDKLGAWSWLGDLHVARNMYVGPGLATLRDGTGDAKVKDKIASMFGTFDPANAGSNHAPGAAAREEVNANVKQHGKTDELLDAGARAGFIGDPDKDAVANRLRGEPASVVLEFAVATALDLARALPLLLAARGVTRDQVMYLWTRSGYYPRVGVLGDDVMRAHLRNALGPRTNLIELFPTTIDREYAHTYLYTNPPMREWAYQDKNPETKLWMAAGSSLAKDACSLVRKEVGFGWVRQLPLTASQVELRRLALNCQDTDTTTYIHEHLIGDRAYKLDPAQSTTGPLPDDVYGKRSDYRLESELKRKDDDPDHAFDPKQVLERLGDLDPYQRVALLANPAELSQLFTKLSDEDALRAVYLLGPSISQLLALPLPYRSGLIDYVATRPEVEQRAVFERPALVARAQAMFSLVSPYVVFSALYAPETLARALQSSPALLEWILERADPSFALAALSAEPVRSVAIALFEERPHIYDKLPAYKHLLPRGKSGFDALAGATKDHDTRGEASDYKAGTAAVDETADRHAERLQDATANGHLWSAIDALAAAHGTQESALALVYNASPSEQLDLLDGGHTPSVQHLRGMVGVSPAHVFRGLTPQMLVELPDAATWMFEVEAPYALLSRMPASSMASVARALERDETDGYLWIMNLPGSAGLTALERRSLDAIAANLSSSTLVQRLFERRFGAEAPSFEADELKRVWTILARLPPAHVNQHVIKTFAHDNLGGNPGLWDGENVVLASDPSSLAGDEKAWEDGDVLTATEVKTFYGLDDRGLDAASSGDHAWIEKDTTAQGELLGYRMKPLTGTSVLSATVLHEVGHSVDTLLGDHTELIYGQGGWMKRGVDQFEEWATEMGALVGVTGQARTDTIDAWKQAIRSQTPVSALVGADHAAMKLPDPNDPLAIAAKDGTLMPYQGSARHEVHNARVFTTNGVNLLSVAERTAHTAPSTYAMSAPAEYFAESYVEYYRDYDGTPQTDKTKGGHLASWIKTWFDHHVDNVELSPGRLNGTADHDTSKKPKTL